MLGLGLGLWLGFLILMSFQLSRRTNVTPKKIIKYEIEKALIDYYWGFLPSAIPKTQTLIKATKARPLEMPVRTQAPGMYIHTIGFGK